MERWTGKVSLVTGANSGIGAAVSKALVKAGMNVIGADVSTDQMEEQSIEWREEKGSLTPVKCDMTSDEDIESLFELIDERFGGLDVCINNAGIASTENLLDGSTSEWRNIMNINVIAYCYAAKLGYLSMLKKGTTQGQIINISSERAHLTSAPGHRKFYAASKHAVKIITEGLRQEMTERNCNIRVASISPGPVTTSFASKIRADLQKDSENQPSLKAEDVASTLIYILSCPPEVELNDVLIRPKGRN